LIGGVPRRVDAATKTAIIELIDQAIEEGWTARRAAKVLGVGELRLRRWRARRDRLDDLASGGNPVHGLLASEVEEILALAEEWGPVDRSHRKLAHRGSYLGRVWVGASTVLRVLAAAGHKLPAQRARTRSERKPWPDWVTYAPNTVWGWDVTHFTRCKPAPNCFAIIDLVSRKWIDTLLSAEETSVQVEVVFTAALEAEGLMAEVEARLEATTNTPLARIDADDEARPILLAVSDNGPEMTSGSTREFMALCSIAQHFGRPGVPTDQAPVESFFGHIKAEWPELEDIRDPEVLRLTLERVRREFNGVRLHAGIGYVTPNDEHEGRGPAIRAARKAGLEKARQIRLAYHRQQREQRSEPPA
jgi:transposase InsO family protein